MKKGEKKQKQIFGLVVALVVVLLGGVLFMGAVSGWFGDEKAVLDDEYRCVECDGEFVGLSIEEYEELIESKKTFVVFVDQGGCTTADRLREYVREWAMSSGVKVYRMMFDNIKQTSLHDFVKYYPSMVVVSKGKVVAWLRADADEDAAAYNGHDDFKGWIEKFLKL